jgi:hypothetical protein
MRRVGTQNARLTLPGVYLLTEGEGRETETEHEDQGRHTEDESPTDTFEVGVPGLELTFLETGVELEDPGGRTVWECRWSDMAEMSPAGFAVLPDGGHALQLLAVERNGTRRHLVVPTEDAEATAASVRRRARSHGLRSAGQSPAVRRTVTVAVAVMAVATVTVLLLAAVHVFSF